MGFFKDFKRDFAQAVNELMPDRDELGAEYGDDDMVDTFDDGDLMEVAPEDMLENLDEIPIDQPDPEIPQADQEDRKQAVVAEAVKNGDAGGLFDAVPEASEIPEDGYPEADVFSEDELVDRPETEYLQAEPDIPEPKQPDETEDELVSLETLDEEDMLAQTGDALLVEPEEEPEGEETSEALKADLDKAVEDTLTRQAEDGEQTDSAEAQEETAMDNTDTETQAKIPVDTIMEADTTYITKNTSVNGDICTDGCIDLIGTVSGSVSCDGKLIIGGSVKGDVRVGELYANAARIEGDVHVADAAKIGVGTVVVGNVFAGSAVIAGAVKGDIDIQGPVIVDSTAVIMGNIKSKSVQINNGAVIEGMCSQCYSEIDVNSFFE